MFNLIPESLRSVIKKEYSFRRAIISLLFVVFVQAVFLVFIFPTWLISDYKEKEIAGKGEEMKNYLSNLNIASTTSNIKSINTKLSVIDKTLKYPDVSPFIDGILSKKTNSIVIKDIVYTATDSKNASISIEGVSATRESLQNFVESLRSSGLFKNVDSPISNLAKDKNLSFSISLTVQLP